jgi:hypothetical protein
MPRQDSKDQIVRTGELGTRAMEQDSWERTGRIGKLDKTGGTEQGQDSQRIQSGQYIQDKKQSTRLPEQDSKKRTTRTVQGDRTNMAGQLAEDIWDRT